MTDELGVEAGQVVAGRYRLVKVLGRGGMGSVWLADHLSLLSPVAVKIIKPEIARSHLSLSRFLREAKAAAMLRSPHVVQILDHGSDGDIAFIAMELLEGESLFQRLYREGRLSPALTLTVMTHVGRAMARAHEAGIVHRDLKPDNVFLVANDDEIVAKVLDFGIAKSAMLPLGTTGDGPQTQTGTLLGTPYYMSPEQAVGDKGIDARTDLWAMGVITFECLVGRRPFQSDSLGELVLQICTKTPPVPSRLAAVPAGFDAWFARAIEREPGDRFQSAKELVAALRQALAATATSDLAPGAQGAVAGGLDADEGSAAERAARRPASDSAPAISSTVAGSPLAAAGEPSPYPLALPSDAAAPATPATAPRPGQTVLATSEPSGVRGSASTLDSLGLGPRTSERPAPTPRRSRLGLMAALGAALVVAAGVGLALRLGSSERADATGGAAASATTRDATRARASGDGTTASAPSAPLTASAASAGPEASASAAASASASTSATPDASAAASAAPRPTAAGTRPTATVKPPPPKGTTTDPLGI
ncbi:MAG: serine/threonine protein kinase [Polyangiaceae bacterium]|nr:serine/threonine protein kinase [Polyangiaceae bacterium]